MAQICFKSRIRISSTDMALKFCLLVSDDLNYDVGRIEPDPEAV